MTQLRSFKVEVTTTHRFKNTISASDEIILTMVDCPGVLYNFTSEAILVRTVESLIVPLFDFTTCAVEEYNSLVVDEIARTDGTAVLNPSEYSLSKLGASVEGHQLVVNFEKYGNGSAGLIYELHTFKLRATGSMSYNPDVKAVHEIRITMVDNCDQLVNEFPDTVQYITIGSSEIVSYPIPTKEKIHGCPEVSSETFIHFYEGGNGITPEDAQSNSGIYRNGDNLEIDVRDYNTFVDKVQQDHAYKVEVFIG